MEIRSGTPKRNASRMMLRKAGLRSGPEGNMSDDVD